MVFKTGMTAAEMQDYLINDLLVSVVNDVGPCLNVGRPEGGYFGVPRMVLSYVDYLGALHNGYNGEMEGNRRKIASGPYATKFLQEVFGKIDSNYDKFGKLLWQVYRNGTVHLYQPLKFKNQSKTIEWLVYKDQRTYTINGMSLTHLVPHKVAGNRWVQPISINCLYDDLQSAIRDYSSRIMPGSILERNFRRTANALQIPEQTRLTWW